MISRLLMVAACALGAIKAQRVGAPTDDLTNLGVEELFSVQVTSVGRKAQQLSKAPAAVFVLTAEDIRRSGATSIPEALQWVPGLTVLRVDGRSWVVSARGSARLYSENMLVMVDGGSLYIPLFSGVIWDAINVPVEEIEQIEVVRGPGAVMWGPNAVNGVINIITRKATETTGVGMSAGAGNELRGHVGASWGAAPSESLAYRVSARVERREPAYDSPGYFLSNSFVFKDPAIHNLNAGLASMNFRVDSQPTQKDRLMLQGNIYTMDRQEPLAYAVLAPVLTQRVDGHSDYKGGFIQGAWTRKSASGGEGVLRFSFNRICPDFPFTKGSINNLTVDYQRRWQTGERNEVYLGGGFLQYSDSVSGTSVRFSPDTSVYRVGNVVLRDEWQAIPGKLLGSVGIRIDLNSYRQVEYQPSFRLIYTPGPRQSAWIAASRAVRAPSRFDRSSRLDFGKVLMQGMPIAVFASGTEDMRSEVERSLEAGYRVQSGQRWSLDTSVFWSSYERVRAWHGPAMPIVTFNGPVPSFLVPLTADNAGAGRSYGGELWGAWQVLPGWKLIPSYTYLNEVKWLPSSQFFQYQWDFSQATVPHQGLLRSQHNLSRTVQLDLTARALSRDPSFQLPGGLLIDARLGWRPARSGELSFSVQNVANRHLLESYSQGPTVAIPVRRTFFVKWTQRL